MLKRTLGLCCRFAVLSLLVACGGGGNPVATDTSLNGIVKGKIAGDGDLTGIPVYLVGVGVNIPPASVRADVSPTSGGNLFVAFTNVSGEFEFVEVPLRNLQFDCQAKSLQWGYSSQYYRQWCEPVRDRSGSQAH